jgi:AraC-like DNA-binding protein
LPANILHLSPGYLSDMLRSLMGQNTQQHFHNKLIEKAKEILLTCKLSVGKWFINQALNIHNHSINCSGVKSIFRHLNLDNLLTDTESTNSDWAGIEL